MSSQFGLPAQTLIEVFPFHLVFDENLVIQQTGKVLPRVMAQTLVGDRLDCHFKLVRPTGELAFAVIKKKVRSLFLLESLEKKIQLKGQMIVTEEQGIIIFLCSIWVTAISDLPPLGIKLKDFAIHDQILDFLVLLQTRDTALEDAKKLNEELTRQKAQLQEALHVLQEKENLVQTATAQAQKLEGLLQELRRTQAKLIQTEKMFALGQLVAGVAHEINNPVSFIAGNIPYLQEYVQHLVEVVQRYQQAYANSTATITTSMDALELDFVIKDLFKILASMRVGVDRICGIVKALRNFSRLDEADIKTIDIHEGIDSSLMILQTRLKANGSRPGISIIKKYGNLPLVECYPGQLNQVFMNLLSNAIDALESRFESRSPDQNASCTNHYPVPTIHICTEVIANDRVAIAFIDNGPGISVDNQNQLFNPFFTTKPIGKGTGLGLSISHEIVTEVHYGSIHCESQLGEGATFQIEIPIKQELRTLSYLDASPS